MECFLLEVEKQHFRKFSQFFSYSILRDQASKELLMQWHYETIFLLPSLHTWTALRREHLCQRSSSCPQRDKEEAKAHLPGCETGGAHQVPTRFNLHVLVVLSTDFTQLERGAHLTVQLILFLRERQHKSQEEQKYAKISLSFFIIDASIKIWKKLNSNYLIIFI